MQSTTTSHYCLKCKLTIEEMVIEDVVKAEDCERYYAIGTCPSCEKQQKRPIKKELALELLNPFIVEDSEIASEDE